MCSRAIGRGWRLVESEARVAPGLHDLLHRELLRVVGLQVRGDEPHALAERFERHARGRARAHDRAADGDPVIPVERAQQCRLARSVASVDHPQLARMHRERDPLEDAAALEIHPRLIQADQSAPAARVRTARALRERRAPVRRLEPLGKRGRAPRTRVHDPSTLEHQCVSRTRGHVFHAVRGEDPGQRPLLPLEPALEAGAIDLIEPVEHLIEQQQARA